MRRSLISVMTVASCLAASPALGLPAQAPDDTWMVNGPRVQTLATTPTLVIVGGVFTATRDEPAVEPVLPARSLVAFDLATGEPVWTTSVIREGTPGMVWDTALGSDGETLYACGAFDHVGGLPRDNVVALDAATGAVLDSFVVATPPCRSLAASRSLLAFGTARSIRAFGLDGNEVWKVRTDGAVRSLALDESGLYAGGRFDAIDGAAAPLVVRLDAGTGIVDDSWWLDTPIPVDDPEGAFVIDLVVDGSFLYVAAGGEDFAAKADTTSGTWQWLTDTSGSVQAIAPLGDGTVAIGGHFRWVADRDTADCGTNAAPVETCTSRLRLAGLKDATGTLVGSWHPTVTGGYNGVWALARDIYGRLHLGGQFTEISGVRQRYYGRLSPVA
jgi:hypothetical protein